MFPIENERYTAPSISVILPSYNRLDILKRVLKSLEEQNIPGERFEIVVSDDCSSDGTREFLQLYKRDNGNTFKYVLAKCNSGPACARNLALQKSKGELIIIIGDDIIVEPAFVGKHIRWHECHPEREYAVLGHVAWPDSIFPSRFMHWLYNGGKQFFFNFSSFRSGEQINCQNFYTCNVSVKRGILEGDLFDESFAFASHEDLELGERLGRKGMKLFYCDDILGHHHHFLRIEGIARRVYLMGRSAHIFWQKVPDGSSIFKKILRNVVKTCASVPGIYSCLLMLLRVRENENQDYPIRWKLILTMCYWLGLADAQKKKKIRTFQEKWN